MATDPTGFLFSSILGAAFSAHNAERIDDLEDKTGEGFKLVTEAGLEIATEVVNLKEEVDTLKEEVSKLKDAYIYGNMSDRL